MSTLATKKSLKARLVENEFDSLLASIRKLESGSYEGNYAAKSKKSSASGAYQFIDKTWKNVTNNLGIGTEFKRASDAPKDIQDKVMTTTLKNNVDKYGTRGAVNVHYTGNPEGKISKKGLKANAGLKSNDYYGIVNKHMAKYKMPSDTDTDIKIDHDNNTKNQSDMMATTSNQDNIPKIDKGPPPGPASVPVKEKPVTSTQDTSSTNKAPSQITNTNYPQAPKVDSWQSSRKAFIDQELNKEEKMVKTPLNELVGKGKIRNLVNKARQDVEKKSAIIPGHRQGPYLTADPIIRAKKERNYNLAKNTKSRADTLHGMVMKKEKNKKADVSDGFNRLKNLRKMKNNIEEEEMSQLSERNKENHKKVRTWEKKHPSKNINDFDTRRMLSPHNKKKVKMKINEVDLSSIATVAKHVGKEFLAHQAVAGTEKAAHGVVGGNHDSEHDHEKEKGTFSNPKFKKLAKGAAEFVVPGSVDAYRDAKKGEYGKAASKFGTGVIKQGLALATKGASEVMSPTPANASENEFKRQDRTKSMAQQKEDIQLALSDLLEENYSGMQDKLSEILGEKAIIALDEKKKIIASNYFGQSE